jgi:hypothetical protein
MFLGRLLWEFGVWGVVRAGAAVLAVLEVNRSERVVKANVKGWQQREAIAS